MKSKTVLGMLGLFLISMVLSQAVYAADVITNRTGTIVITRPDGVILTIGKDEPLPDIPSGSTVEILDGSADIAPTAGFIQVVVGNTTATVTGGQEIQVGLDEATGAAEIKSVNGVIETITVGVKASISDGGAVVISADSVTRNVHVESTSGTVVVTTTDGTVINVTEDNSIDTTGSATGEIETFVETPEEVEVPLPEPEEPPRTEGSPYMP